MAIIVGDIHGNGEKVRAFLEYKPEAEHIALGDYLDSFYEPQQRQIEALQILIDSQAVLLWGNHDLHYLLHPPFRCSGYQHGREAPLQEIINANKKRFMAAYAVDGWLCTHAGVHENLVRTTDIYELADRFSKYVWCSIKDHSAKASRIGIKSQLFGISSARGGDDKFSGIFWFDFLRDRGLATNIKQVFGHTETREPVMTETYVALDTTNCAGTCYLFDTETNEVVKLKI